MAFSDYIRYRSDLVGFFVEGVLGLFAKYWIKLISPIVAASVVTSIGFSLLSVGRKLDDSKMTALTIPNKEIRDIFETTVIKWFDDSARMWNRKALFDAVWSGNSESITYEMNKLLRKTISYHDYREDFFHIFLCNMVIFICRF